MRHPSRARQSGIAALAAVMLMLGLAAAPATAGPSEITATLGSCTYEFNGATVPCEPLATLQGQHVTLWMGSDAGVVCVDMHLPDLGVGTNVGWRAAVVLGQPEYSSATVIDLGWGGAGGAVQRCIGGIDQFVLNDLFSDPGRYWAIVEMVEAIPVGPPCPLACGNLMGQFAFVSPVEAPEGGGPSGGGQLPDTSSSSAGGSRPWVELGALLLLIAGAGAMIRGRRGSQPVE